MRSGKITIFSVLTCLALLFSFIQPTAYSASEVVNVYFNGELIQFDNAQPVMKDGRTLVPFRKIFETLGFTVKWVDSGKKQQAIGTKDGLTIELTINSTSAKVNGKNVSLDVPAQIVKQSTMVPLRFVSENSGYDVGFAKNGNVYTIQVGDASEFIEPPKAPPAPAPSLGNVEPYVVKGRVTDGDGNPIEGIKVYADNMLAYDSNLVAVTDADGLYRIDLPDFATTWNMMSTHTVELDGRSYSIDLIPDIDQPFGTKTGAIRNFSYDLTGGVYIHLNMDLNPELDYFDVVEQFVEVTLIPIGPSHLGGNGGKPITEHPVSRDEFVTPSLVVPVGKYRATARLAAEGYEPEPLLIRVKPCNGSRCIDSEYAESVEFDFYPEGVFTYLTDFLIELEVTPPNY